MDDHQGLKTACWLHTQLQNAKLNCWFRRHEDAPDANMENFWWQKSPTLTSSNHLCVFVRWGTRARRWRGRVPAADTGRRRVTTNEFKLQVISHVGCGLSIVAIAEAHALRCPSSILAWVRQKEKLRAERVSQGRSKVSLGSRGRPELFLESDVVAQWIKEMRRENNTLKTSHIVEFFKEEFAWWTEHYRSTRKSASLYALSSAWFVVTGLLSGVQPIPCFYVKSYIKSSAPSRLRLELLFAGSTRQNQFSIPMKPVFISTMTVAAGLLRRAPRECKFSRQPSFVPVLCVPHVAASGKTLRPLITFKAPPGGTVKEECSALPARAMYAVQERGWWTERRSSRALSKVSGKALSRMNSPMHWHYTLTIFSGTYQKIQSQRLKNVGQRSCRCLRTLHLSYSLWM